MWHRNGRAIRTTQQSTRTPYDASTIKRRWSRWIDSESIPLLQMLETKYKVKLRKSIVEDRAQAKRERRANYLLLIWSLYILAVEDNTRNIIHLVKLTDYLLLEKPRLPFSLCLANSSPWHFSNNATHYWRGEFSDACCPYVGASQRLRLKKNIDLGHSDV